jgi:hypothetical protein
MSRLKVFALSIFCMQQTIAATVDCPGIINTHQTLQQEINGWNGYTAATDAQQVLQGVTFYDRHPSENASLAPDNETPKDNKLVWSFDQKDNIWVACRYSNTNVQLIKKLPKALDNCTVTYDANYSRVIRIDC